jgi:[protein-PII] uridylyltransferase
MDFRVEEAVMEALPFVDDLFRGSQKVNQTFFSILKKGKGVAPLLTKMHELGLLSRYIPEFSEIAGRIHYDLYHVHPVDIHSLLAVEELEKLKNGSYENEAPLLTALIREVEEPEILFLVTLLHDIGKSTKTDHSLAGAEMVKRIGARMGLSQEQSERAGFLVSQHLLMVTTALRRDLHDEQVILRFANQVRNLSQLKMLYLLTFADIKAVGGESWTSWKNILLMDLFLKTSHFFERNARAEPFIEGTDTMKGLRQSLPPEIISEYEDHLPDRYLSCYSAEEITHHIEMARSLGKESLRVEWEVEKETQAKVTVCTRDRYGLFSRITGSMFLNRLNILEAQIHTWGNGVALDTFWVEDSTKEIERRLLQLKRDLKEILDARVSIKDLLLKRKESNGIKQKIIPRVAGEVKINNQDSDFFTIVEVTGENRLGVLYEMTEALTDFGCDIHFARISTLGNRIVDVFYVQDEWGEKITERNKVEQLKRSVSLRLTSGENRQP